MSGSHPDGPTARAGSRTAPQAGRLLMGLYPAAYRAAHGEDIAAVFAETTEGMTRRQILRERTDLARHALRLRLRISADDPTGRVLAGAAPVTLAVSAGLALYLVMPRIPELVLRLRQPYPSHDLGADLLAVALFTAVAAPWLVALGAAVMGRWRVARKAGLLGALVHGTMLLTLFGPPRASTVGEAAGPALTALVLLLAPAGQVDSGRRGRWETAGLALAVALPLTAADRFGVLLTGGPIGLRQPTLQCAAAAVLLALHLSARRPDLLRAAGIALGVLPWLLFVPTALLFGRSELGHLLRILETALAPFGLALTIGLVAQFARRARRTTETSGPGGLA
ncbi:hypothetical protein ACIRBX_08075 [Kitasatospora sp. NPDC096147]|uniref:hypothetical protein n=1 Tax=Kitasatospora sp. NPDC096147 TaxID=3364093 RepID=UPI003800193E